MRSILLVGFTLMGSLDLGKKVGIFGSVFLMFYGFDLVANVNLGRVIVMI